MSNSTRNQTIPEHIFISFSQDDRTIAEAIVKTLEKNDIPAWIDYSRLAPGTPDWEAAIRDSIEKSFAVVVLASPQSRASRYVRGELSLAESKGRHIYPFWIGGTEWSDCIPLGMAYAQYIDGRGARAEIAIAELSRVLEQHIRSAVPKHYLVSPLWRRIDREGGTLFRSRRISGDVEIGSVSLPPGFASIELTEGDDATWEEGGSAVFVRTSDYSSIQALLDDLYLHYLTDRFKPLTYGSIWIMQEESLSYDRLLVPWSWLLTRQSSSEMEHRWLHQTSLSECGLVPRSSWRIRDTSNIEAMGVAVNDERIWRAMRSSAKATYFFRRHGILLDQPVARVSSDYRFRFVFTGGRFFEGPPLPGTAMVQTDKALEEHVVEHWLD